MFKAIKSSSILLMLLFFSNSYSQDKIIDSLKTVLRNPKLHDTTKLAKIGAVMDSRYTENNPNYFYLNKLIGTLARKNLGKNNNKIVNDTYTSWLATYYNVLAIDYSHKNDAVKGLAALDKSIQLYKSIKSYDDANYQLIVKGAFYSIINENGKAIYCIFSALKYFEKDKKENFGEIAYAMSVLANIYYTLGNYEKSIAYNKKAIEYYNVNNAYQDYQRDHLKSISYSNIANGYSQLKVYSEVGTYGEKGLALSRKIGDDTTTSIILCRVGLAKMAQLDYKGAEAMFKEALSLSTDERATAQANLMLGNLYAIKKEMAKAKIYVGKALATGNKNKDLELQKSAYWMMSDIWSNLNNVKQAIKYYDLHEKISDSLKSNSSKNILVQQQLKYDFENKELNYKLATEKKNAVKNNLLIGLSGALLLGFLGLYFYYRNNKQTQAITVLEKDQIKQKLLITQMNPHFIFNSIDNIQGLIHDKKEDEAINYLTRFSKLTRQILENSNENYISLSEEIEMTENYLAIQQLLYASKFNFSVDIENTIDTDTLFLPPMLTQPFIENAIKHGLAGKSRKGMIKIRFYLKDAKLFFEVVDNGEGFNISKRNGSHKSLAMTITKERLVNYTKNQEFVIEAANIKDKDENVMGAKVVFEIPYIYEK